MGFDLENDGDVIEIDFRDGSMKGTTTAKNWDKHMKKLRQVMEGKVSEIGKD